MNDNFKKSFEKEHLSTGFYMRTMMSKDEIKKSEKLVDTGVWFKGYSKEGHVTYSFTKETHNKYNVRK